MGTELSIILIILLLLSIAASVWINYQLKGLQTENDHNVEVAKEQIRNSQKALINLPTPDYAYLWPVWFTGAAIGLAAGFLLGRHAA